jgi:hypothetical protein
LLQNEFNLAPHWILSILYRNESPRVLMQLMEAYSDGLTRSTYRKRKGLNVEINEYFSLGFHYIESDNAAELIQ